MISVRGYCGESSISRGGNSKSKGSVHISSITNTVIIALLVFMSAESFLMLNSVI